LGVFLLTFSALELYQYISLSCSAFFFSNHKCIWWSKLHFRYLTG